MNIESYVMQTLKYLERVGIAFSILLNVVLGGASNQTFSARNYRWKQQGKPHLVWLIDTLVFWDKDHCFHSWIYFKTTRDLRKSFKRQRKREDPLKVIYEIHEYLE